MIEREMSLRLKKLRGRFPVVLLRGATTVGMFTLARHVLSDYQYVTLENPNTTSQGKLTS